MNQITAFGGCARDREPLWVAAIQSPITIQKLTSSLSRNHHPDLLPKGEGNWAMRRPDSREVGVTVARWKGVNRGAISAGCAASGGPPSLASVVKANGELIDAKDSRPRISTGAYRQLVPAKVLPGSSASMRTESSRPRRVRW